MIKIKKNQKEIPIFFATDDNYIAFLDVALRSLIANASKKYKYVINILNTGLRQENKDLIQKLELPYVQINFCDISNQVEGIKNKLIDCYHFSLVTYYRLFIENLFPQYDKVLYLDCDIVVLGDISKLYNTPLFNNYLGAVMEQVINTSDIFSKYSDIYAGVDHKRYFNAGVLVMNLKKFREDKIEDQFIYLINNYGFDTIAPDQDYLNVLCKDRVSYLSLGWNKESVDYPYSGEVNLVHYALYKKPWQYDDVLNGQYFWDYAKQSPFYNKILEIRDSFDDVAKTKKEKANVDIVEHAIRLINTPKSFNNLVVKNKTQDDSLDQLLDNIISSEFIKKGI